jgi:uncharacterized linocin/CFP29 family protein
MRDDNSYGDWAQPVWDNINSSVKTAIGNIRVAQRVFLATQLPGVTSVPANILHPDRMSISEGETKPYIEISAEFPLTYGQVHDDPNGLTGVTLAKLAAKSLALAEDMLFFQGKGVKLPPAVHVESGLESAAEGILGLVSPDSTFDVHPPDRAVPTNSGSEILAAVARGIAVLTKEGQAPPFGLILDTNAFAETWGSVINGAPTYTVLNPIVTQGIFGTGAMPANTGLLVAVAGDPTTIYYDNDPTTEVTQRDSKGRYLFRVFERVQFVASDKRAFVKLRFPDGKVRPPKP